MNPDLVLNVEDLIGHLQKHRGFDGSRHVALQLGDASVDDRMHVDGRIDGTLDGVQVQFTAKADASLMCVRCLREWVETIEVTGSQHFSKTPDEDGYAIEEGRIDIGGPATDELALGLPAAPLHAPDCKGLCPICGTDLNSAPCDGHGDDSDSPFAVLKDLFDS